MSPMMTGTVPWWVSAGLLSLLAEVNEAWPDRDKTSDGTIGDARHQAESQSDHNPLPDGEVCALDITTKGIDAPWLAEHLAASASFDPRIKYVIFNRRIFNLSVSPDWRPYDGVDPHTNHIHLSVHPNAAATPSWGVAEGVDMPLSAADLTAIGKVIKASQDVIILHVREPLLAKIATLQSELDTVKSKIGA